MMKWLYLPWYIEGNRARKTASARRSFVLPTARFRWKRIPAYRCRALRLFVRPVLMRRLCWVTCAS